MVPGVHSSPAMNRTTCVLNGAAPLLAIVAVGCNASGVVNDSDPERCAAGEVARAEGDGCMPAPRLLVQGIVRDEVTGALVSGAEVRIYPPGELVGSDANGYFGLEIAPATGGVLVTCTHPAYLPATLSLARPSMELGTDVIDASLQLTPRAGTTLVAGTLYAGDRLAAGATVVLHDTTRGYDAYAAQSSSNGRFTFTDVAYGSYRLLVRPFDEDGDGVTDFAFFELPLGDIEVTTALNLSNLVVALQPVSRSILYSNLVGLATPFTGPMGVVPGVLRLAGPDDDIVLHFGARVDPDSVNLVLLPFETGNGGATGTGEPLPIHCTWSASDTVLHIDPQVVLTADALADSQYELRLQSLLWEDGQVFVSPTSPASYLALRFDVAAAPTLPSSPTPELYLDNKVTAYQTAAAVSCDARVCWLLDEQGYYFGDYADPVPGTAMPSGWNGGGGLQLAWAHVPGATAYWIYVRQRSQSATAAGFSQWYSLGRAGVDSATTPTDPELGPVVFVDNVLQVTPGARNDWAELDRTGAGPLAFGTELDLAVTTIDATGYESPLDSQSALTLADTTPASLRGAVLDASGAGVQAARTELGTSLADKVVKLQFTEYLFSGAAPILEVHSGNVLGTSAAAASSWDSADPLSPQNVSDEVALGPITLRLRGACTPITCGAAYNEIEPALSDDSVCVRAPEVFDSGEVIFVDAAAALVHDALMLATVDVTNRRLRFTSPVRAELSLDTPIFACAVSPAASDGTTTTLTATAHPGATTVQVADASMFHAGAPVLLFDTASGVLVRHAVAALTTGEVSRLRLDAALDSGLGAGSTVVLRAPTAAEYALRPVTTATLRHGVQVEAPTVRLDFTSSLTRSSAMVGDLCLIDVDGVLVTTADRYFAEIVEIAMDPDLPSAGTDESDHHLILSGPPDGLPALPAGTFLQPGATLVLALGDSLRVVNGAASSPVPLSDTSGNPGLNAYRDQVSACVSPVPATCSNGVFVY